MKALHLAASRAWPGAIAICAALIAAAAQTPAQAAEEIQTGLFSDLAVGGYDPVTYFTQGEPTRGAKAHQTEWKGATWRFSSAENLAAFEASPETYAPQYGGYCAWAVSQGQTAPGSPMHWSIVDDKLYLNNNARVKADWERDIPGFIEAADANWPAVLD